MSRAPGVEPGTVQVWADIACPWAHVAVARIHRIRGELGFADRVRLDMRPFALELANDRPTPKRILDAEIPVAGALEPGAGWEMWQAAPSEWPVTALPALEAVQAAKEQGLVASEELDLGLRRALFGESRCISMRNVILDVAERSASVDAEALGAALDDGRARRDLVEDHRWALDGPVDGSPHVFVPGRGVHNPGIEMHWEGEHGRGFPVVDADDGGAVYRDLLTRAAESTR